MAARRYPKPNPALVARSLGEAIAMAMAVSGKSERELLGSVLERFPKPGKAQFLAILGRCAKQGVQVHAVPVPQRFGAARLKPASERSARPQRARPPTSRLPAGASRFPSTKSVLASIRKQKSAGHCLDHFELGEVLATTSVKRLIPHHIMHAAIYAHQHCDWGDVSRAEAQANNAATFSRRASIRSVHHARLNPTVRSNVRTVEFWVVTHPLEGATVVLFPEEA